MVTGGYTLNDTVRFLVGFVCMMLCVILPLHLTLRPKVKSTAAFVLSMLGLYAFWYLTMATLHEGAHYLGSLLSGQQVLEVRLIPHFWKGDFVAYVHTKDMSPEQGLVSVPAPYVLDLVSLLIGLGVLRLLDRSRTVLFSLLLTFLCLRPLFDLVSNYLGYAVLDYGDFRILAETCGPVATHAAGVALCGIAIGVVAHLVRRGRQAGPATTPD